MQALILNDGVLQLRNNVQMPSPQKHEVLVQVICTGICETDLQLVQGYMNYSGILGHEFVGIALDGKYAGKRVVGEINCCPETPCDACPSNRHHCSQRTVLGILNHDGAFAEYVAVPEDNLHLVPDHVENDRAVFVEPLAAAFRIPEQIQISDQQNIIVLGDGRLGYLISQVLLQHSTHVTVVGKHPEKLTRFSKQGINTALLSKLTPSPHADIVVDCTGSSTGFPLAMQLVRPQGTVILKTTIADQQTLSLASVVIDEVKVIGSRCGPFKNAINALSADEIEVSSMITSRFGLSQAEEAFQVAMQKDQHKVLIDVLKSNT
ncbi:MAG: alcohol dehydrogenase catalytic domain-containing protein [Planctomycetaceae bacterium]|nr:alcohol dehydrogenase catalytic domain-containing protein [Planctomycetaceae bacterium]